MAGGNRTGRRRSGGYSPRNLPDTQTVSRALDEARARSRLTDTLRSTAFLIIAAVAVFVLIVALFQPVLRIYGNSMQSTLNSGDIALSVKTADYKTGDVVAFYYNNNILVKRVIATSGDVVDIDRNGVVTVNKEKIDEPYLSSRAYGSTDIDLPYQVPDGKLFVMGDNRGASTDSRNRAIGCVSSEQAVGKVIFRIWPLTRIGPV